MQDSHDSRGPGRSKRRRRRVGGPSRFDSPRDLGPSPVPRQPVEESYEDGGHDPRFRLLDEAGEDFVLRYVLAETRRPPAWREIDRALRTLEGVVRETGRELPGAPLYRYRNPDTLVECHFVGYEADELDEIGLAFRMPQPRPEYFAHEALPLAVQLARELRVDTVPHGPDAEKEPGPPSKESLLAVWLRSNAEARKRREAEHGPSPRCSGENLELAWEYLTLRDDLDRRYSRRGILVPTIEYVKVKKTGEVLRLCRWSDMRPTVFPPVDLIYLNRPAPPLKTGKIVSADELSEVARRWVRDIVQPIFHRLYVEDRPPADFLEALDGLKGTTMRSYEEVAVEDLEDC